MRPLFWRRLAAVAVIPLLLTAAACADEPGGGSADTIKVGILHSLSGTMSISEVTVKDAELLAIEEINATGGVLGKQIEPVIEDGASDWPTFAEKAQKLISEDKVAIVFGCWTSASRKAVLPVFEELKGLLWYPVQYEGLESSPNIFYTGATTNQQIVPGLDYLQGTGQEEDLPARLATTSSRAPPTRSSRRTRRPTAWRSSARSTRRSATPSTARSINKITAAKPDVVFNTLNGDSNVAFFKQLKDAGITAADHAGPLGQRGRGGGQGHRAGEHRRPPGGLELLPDDRGRRRTRSSSPPTRPSTAPTR